MREVQVGPQRLARWLAGFAERHGPSRFAPISDGAHLSGEDGAEAWVHLPFGRFTGTTSEQLIAQATAELPVGVLLARRGGYAAGVFHGATLLASKVGSSYVQGTTKAGGWSQQRYARRREMQAGQSRGRAADVAAAVLLDRPLRALFLGGDRRTVEAVLDDPRLQVLTPLVTDRFLAVPDPRERVLRATPEQFMALRIELDP